MALTVARFVWHDFYVHSLIQRPSTSSAYCAEALFACVYFLWYPMVSYAEKNYDVCMDDVRRVFEFVHSLPSTSSIRDCLGNFLSVREVLKLRSATQSIGCR